MLTKRSLSVNSPLARLVRPPKAGKPLEHLCAFDRGNKPLNFFSFPFNLSCRGVAILSKTGAVHLVPPNIRKLYFYGCPHVLGEKADFYLPQTRPPPCPLVPARWPILARRTDLAWQAGREPLQPISSKYFSNLFFKNLLPYPLLKYRSLFLASNSFVHAS